MLRAVFIVVTAGSLLLLAPGPARAGADDHLIAGAEHFQQGRFAQALVEFRVAERLGAGGEALWYAAAALVKLGRSEEALVRFSAAEAAAPEIRDALLDYYRALACHQARLYQSADRLLAGIGERAGARIAAQAAKLRADLLPLLRAEPGPATIDWYHARAAAALERDQSPLALSYFEEALVLSARRGDRYRERDALAGVTRARQLAQRGTGP